MTSKLLVVQTNAVTGRDDEFNEWYTHRHLADVTGMPGAVAAQRFEMDPEERAGDFRYLALYEVASPRQLARSLDTYRNSPRMPISEALDPKTSAYFYEDMAGYGDGWIAKERTAIYVEAVNPGPVEMEEALRFFQLRMKREALPPGFSRGALLRLTEWQWRENAWQALIAVYDVDDLQDAQRSSAWRRANPYGHGRFYNRKSNRVVGSPHKLEY